MKSNDKEDTCKKCNFKAKTGNNLKMHMRKEHKFSCKVCDYSSTTKVQMNQHVKCIKYTVLRPRAPGDMFQFDGFGLGCLKLYLLPLFRVLDLILK